MVDLRVDDGAVASFAAAVGAHAGVAGAECTAAGHALGSGIVQDALGNVSLVLTVLDQALADGAGALAHDARSTELIWGSTDTGIAMRAV
ncbi:alpha-mannosidase [Cellulomonas dongxiuzhuiae]|uniref:alpha-mannosidase n=1 Tax=Cellulomonas dongxiuzhuiae TaxID=2819979 RepID=UPI001AAF77E6|nr:alpha-mannosidase [Cellulomonas dongxiuzhuiae]MBO3089410.1 alpha-mannosidase [Cellulomonas dongxiuzhuiae]